MPRRSYLSPQFRNLHTEQIGPSSHKNEFRNGVLVGNWFEDRLPRAPGASLTGSSDGTALPPLTTTHQAQFYDKTRAVPSQPMQKTPDMGRSLLFGHSPSGAPVPESAHMPEKQVDRFQSKRATWRRETDPDLGGTTTSMTSTKREEMDRVGELVKRDRSVLEGTKVKSRAGGFTGTFGSDGGTMGLRTPFAMSNTPLVRR